MTNKELAAQCLIEAAEILGDIDNSNVEILEESIYKNKIGFDISTSKDFNKNKYDVNELVAKNIGSKFAALFDALCEYVYGKPTRASIANDTVHAYFYMESNKPRCKLTFRMVDTRPNNTQLEFSIHVDPLHNCKIINMSNRLIKV